MSQIFFNSPVKASSIIGTSVVNPEGQSLGDIKEVVIDPYTGKVAYSVVAFGGFLSMGEKLFAIPFSAFKYNFDRNEYILDVSKERLAAAPGFDVNPGRCCPTKTGIAPSTNITNAHPIGSNTPAGA